VITRHGTSGCAAPDLIACASCRFADNLYPVKHRAVQQVAGAGARPVVLDAAPDPADRGQDVRQRFTVSLTRRRPRPGPGPGCAPSAHPAQPPPHDARRSLNLKRETAEAGQRGVRTRGYQEIHITRLGRFPASYRTGHTHITQAAPGRGRENLPPEPPEGTPDPAAAPAAVDLALGVLPPYTRYWCPQPLHRTPGQTTRSASCQASQLAAAPVVQSRMLLASHASSQSGPSRRTP
jgi:hypothetical protein